MNKYLKLSNIFIIPLLAAALISCGKNKSDNEFAAKVDKSTLSQKELNLLADSSTYRNLSKQEIINEWIQNEVLFKEAERNGILNDSKFQAALSLSKKKLAAGFLLDKIYDEYKPEISESEIANYFNTHKEEFKLSHKAFFVNLAIFNNQEDAVKFRNEILGKNWEQALFSFKDNKALVKFETRKLIYYEDVEPSDLAEVLNQMHPGEISVLLPLGNDFIESFLINKFEDETVPTLDAVKLNVKARLLEVKKNEYLKIYMNKLYSKYAIEIKGEK
ncbi:MAG: peptidylprolyl isomerase [Bacteroidota bacterium]|nr:peptidylprolyl isomerase [Bacteroidota bacterium]